MPGLAERLKAAAAKLAKKIDDMSPHKAEAAKNPVADLGAALGEKARQEVQKFKVLAGIPEDAKFHMSPKVAEAIAPEQPHKIEEIHYMVRPLVTDTPMAKAAKYAADKAQEAQYEIAQKEAARAQQAPVDMGELDEPAQVSPAQKALDRLDNLVKGKKVE